MRRAALVLIALALTSCETSAEKSAKLEKIAKREATVAARHQTLAQRGLSIARPSTTVTVTATEVLHSSEGAAAVVTLHNRSATALRDVPIEIAVRNAAGATIYTNAAPGLARSLVSVPLVPAHATGTWIDDQVQASGVPTSVSARVGEGERATGAIPQLAVAGTHLAEGELEGSVVNHSQIVQHELVLYALAWRAGAIVAAGRAVVPVATPGSSSSFQVFFIGDPQGARIEVSAPPSTIG